jgi:hypothetical protein
VWRALSLMLTVLALVGIPARALASDAPPKTAEEAAEDEPVKPSENRKGEVKEIGLYITNVGKIDVQKESWELEAQLTISSTGRLRKCAVPQIQELFPSGTVKKVDEVDEWEEGPKKFRQCKVSLEHESTIDVSRYPFDKHDLEVLVGDEGDAADGVEFKPLADPEATGVSPTAKLTGWQLGELTATQETFDHAHTKAKLTRVAFALHVTRPPMTSFLKGFLAVLFQLVIALVALVLAVKAAPNRLGIATGALIAVATAHNTISSQIGVSYVTTADKFFYLSYFLLLVNVGFSAAMIRAEDQKKDELIKTLYKTAWMVLPALTLIGSALVLSGVL